MRFGNIRKLTLRFVGEEGEFDASRRNGCQCTSQNITNSGYNLINSQAAQIAYILN